MIKSLFDLLRDCLPIYAAWTEAQMLSGVKDGLPPASVLRRFMFATPVGVSFEMHAPPLPNIDPKTFWEKVQSNWSLQEAVLSTHLWGWEVNHTLNQILDVQCRGREAGYRLFGVLPKITFGHDGQPFVRVTTKVGQTVDLPLDSAHLVAQFHVRGGTVPQGGKNPLWPLESRHDSGLVRVFAYEPSLDSAGKIKTPLASLSLRGRGNWQPLDPQEKALANALVPQISTPLDLDPWLEVMTGPFMNVPGVAKQTTAKTNETRTAQVLRPRIVVALSFSTFRERADFEPGALVGMAKIFPHIMVCSSIPLASMEASVKIERTPKTTYLDQGNGTGKMPCCGAYEEVGALLVTDANEGGMFTQKPFWGGTFAYVEQNAGARFAGKRLKVVDRSKKEHRKYPGGKRLLVRRETGAFTREYWESLFGFRSYELQGVEKVPGQGEWDNIHLAPQLKLDLVKWAISRTTSEYYVPPDEFPVDQDACHTRKVWMAPFCAHDCFHTHWRWGATDSAPWAFGWNANGPYKEPGAPMVPLWQDVELEVHGPSAYSYHVKSNYGARHVPGTWDVVMHHGAAYAQSIADWAKFTGSQFNVALEQGASFFYDSKGKLLTLADAPLMYWLFRYQVGIRDGQVFVTDRIQFSQDEVDGARKA